MSRLRSLSGQTLALALGSGSAQVLVAVLYIVTARGTRPAEYGIIATAIALGMVGAGFVDLGASSYWIRELAGGRTSLEQLYPRMVARLLVAACLAAVVIAVAANTDPHFIATGFLLLSSTAVLTMLVPLRAGRRADLVGWLSVSARVISVVVFFLQMALGVPLGVALWTSIAFGDLCLVVYLGASKHSPLRSGSIGLRNPWAGAKWYSLSQLSATAHQLDLPIVAATAGAGASGIYAGVNRWIQPMLIAGSAFALAVAPFLAAEGQLRDLRRQVFRASWILLAAVFFSACVIFAAPWLVVVLLGQAFAGSAPVLQWLAAGMILNTLTQPLIAALQSRRFDHLAGVILFVSVGVQLAIVGTLSPRLGALGAGVGFFVGQVLQLIGIASCVAVIVWRRRNKQGLSVA